MEEGLFFGTKSTTTLNGYRRIGALRREWIPIKVGTFRTVTSRSETVDVEHFAHGGLAISRRTVKYLKN